MQGATALSAARQAKVFFGVQDANTGCKGYGSPTAQERERPALSAPALRPTREYLAEYAASSHFSTGHGLSFFRVLRDDIKDAMHDNEKGRAHGQDRPSFFRVRAVE